MQSTVGEELGRGHVPSRPQESSSWPSAVAACSPAR